MDERIRAGPFPFRFEFVFDVLGLKKGGGRGGEKVV